MTAAEYHRSCTTEADPLEADFDALGSRLANAPDLDEVLAVVLEFAVSSLNCDWATIRLSPRRAPLLAVDDDLAAMLLPSAVTISDAALDRRRPLLSRLLLRLGIRSAHLVELMTGTTTVGRLCLYAAQPDRFTDDDKRSAQLLAAHAALAIADTRQTSALTGVVHADTPVGPTLAW